MVCGFKNTASAFMTWRAGLPLHQYGRKEILDDYMDVRSADINVACADLRIYIPTVLQTYLRALRNL